MVSKLYVGNVSFGSTEEEIKEHFSAVGEVLSVKIISDRETGRSRGFCFIEMENADAAIEELNGKELNGRRLNISTAREREQRSGVHFRGGADDGFQK